VGLEFAGAVLDVGVTDLRFRVTADPAAAGCGRVSVGVADLAAERNRLLAQWPGLPEASVKPGVITLLRLPDPDGNEVTLWQDLLHSGAGR
jgi:hypothetical protein